MPLQSQQIMGKKDLQPLDLPGPKLRKKREAAISRLDEQIREHCIQIDNLANTNAQIETTEWLYQTYVVRRLLIPQPQVPA